MSQAVAPLRIRQFRSLWIASIFSNVGSFLQAVAGAWLMLELTGSATWVGLMAASTTLPLLFLALAAGAVADLANRGKVLLISQSLMGLAAAGMAAITTLDVVTPGRLLGLSLLLGVGVAFNLPAWQAMVPDLVPRGMVASAVALNSVAFNVARAVGPALGGLISGNRRSRTRLHAQRPQLPRASSPCSPSSLRRFAAADRDVHLGRQRHRQRCPLRPVHQAVPHAPAAGGAVRPQLSGRTDRPPESDRGTRRVGRRLRPTARRDGTRCAGRSVHPPAGGRSSRCPLDTHNNHNVRSRRSSSRPLPIDLVDRSRPDGRRDGLGLDLDHHQCDRPADVAGVGQGPGDESVLACLRWASSRLVRFWPERWQI